MDSFIFIRSSHNKFLAHKTTLLLHVTEYRRNSTSFQQNRYASLGVANKCQKISAYWFTLWPFDAYGFRDDLILLTKQFTLHLLSTEIISIIPMITSCHIKLTSFLRNAMSRFLSTTLQPVKLSLVPHLARLFSCMRHVLHVVWVL